MNRIWKHRMLATWMPKTLLLLAGAVVITACGGGDDDQTQPASNQAPVASADSPAAAVGSGDMVTLNGLSSSDTDGYIASHSWVQVSPSSHAISLANANAAVATFTAPAVSGVKPFEFQLTVTDNGGLIATKMVRIVISNTNPVANAGASQTVRPRTKVTLDGSGSNDPGSGTITTYSWRQIAPEAPALAIENVGKAKIAFTAPAVTQVTTFTFRLEVTDADALTGTDEVSITVSNALPTVVVEDVGTVRSEAVVTLDGSGSFTGQGKTILTYQWEQLDTGVPTVTLANADKAAATFTVPELDADVTFKFRLTITDSAGLTHSTELTIKASDTVPVVMAGEDQTVDPGAAVTLGGTSSPAEGRTIVTYEWTQLAPQMPTINLAGADMATATFTAPDIAVGTQITFEFQLEVTDSEEDTNTDTVSITVSNPALPPNTAPTAMASSAAPVVIPGTVVTLDGSGSRDAEDNIASYAWTQLSPDAPTIELTNEDMAMATFTAPTVAMNTSFTFALTVTDEGELSDTDEVTIKVSLPPTAEATTESTEAGEAVAAGVTVTLTGGNPGGGNVTYSWEQASGPTVSLTGGDTATATFTAPAELMNSTLRFELTVTDADGNTIETTVSVVVNKIDLSELRGVSVSDDGMRAVTGGMDGKVRLWDVAARTEITTFGAGTQERSLGSHHGPVYAVAISGDGMRAISGGHDGAVKLWNTDAEDETDNDADGIYGDEIRYGVTNDNPGRSLRDGGIWVYAVALDADGSHAASGGFDGQVRLWNTSAMEIAAVTDVSEAAAPGAEFTYPVVGVTNMADELVADLSNRGYHITVDDGAMENDTSDDTYTRNLGSHSGTFTEDINDTPTNLDDDADFTTYYSVYAVSLSDDGSRVLSGGADGTVRVWNAANGMELITGGLTDGGATPGEIMGPIYGVALSGDGAMAVAGGADNKVRVWNIDTNDMATQAREFTTPADVSSVSLNAAKTHILSVGGDGFVRFWTLGANSDADIAAASRLHADYVWSASLNGLGTKALSVDADGLLRIWDTNPLPSETTEPFVNPPPPDVEPEIDHDDNMATDNIVRRDDVVRQELHPDTAGAETTAHSGNVRGVALSGDGEFALSGGHQTSGAMNTTLRLWDTSTGTQVLAEDGSPLLEPPANETSGGTALNADGRVAMVGNSSGSNVYDKDAGAWIHRGLGPVWANRLYLTPDGRLGIATYSEAANAMIWDVATGASVATLSLPGHSVSAVALSADGSVALMGGDSQDKVDLWTRDSTTGDYSKREIHDHSPGTQTINNPVGGVALSVDGTYGLSASGDKTARFYQLGEITPQGGGDKYTGVINHKDLMHVSGLQHGAMSADGTLAITGVGDAQAVYLWDTTGAGTRLYTPLRVMGDHTEQLNAVSLSADGRTAISGGSDNRAILWHLGGSRTISPLFETTAEAAANPAEAVAGASTMVTLTGDGTDTSGKDLLAYYWRQTAPPGMTLDAADRVTLSADNAKTATFDVSTVTAAKTLTFEFTVTDAQGLIKTAAPVTVTITAPAGQ